MSSKMTLMSLLVALPIMAFTQANINILAPQTYDFVKYGNVPISHYTGELNLKIPIYTYSDRDFQLPIYLGYNSAGFIPQKREGIVGLNFFVNAGGVITRNVNGYPDERMGDFTFSKRLHGQYYGAKQNMLIKNKTKAEIFNVATAGSVDADLWWSIGNCEVEPDDFMFNMPGHNGKFLIDNTGTPRIAGDKQYKIDLSQFALQQGTGVDISDSKIIITTDDGYIFTFGGAINYLEVSYPLQGNEVNVNSNTTHPVINAWHLSEIQAPNGRKVIFEYMPFIQGLAGGGPADPYHYLLQAYGVQVDGFVARCVDFFGGPCSSTGSPSSKGLMVREATKTVYLKNIKVDDFVIAFLYGEKQKKFFTSTPPFGNFNILFNQQTYQLNEIQVKHANGAIIKDFDFEYTYYGGGYGERLFLTSFAESGTPAYTFEYNKTEAIPDPRTTQIDHWGFFKGGNGSITDGDLIPQVDYSENGDVSITSSEREPTEWACDIALLKSVKYPTGGSTNFSYEPHFYSKRLERRAAADFLTALYSVNGFSGGARIRRIADHDGTRETNIKEFKYVKDYYNGGTESSGVLLSWPRYFFYFRYDNDGERVSWVNRRSSTYNVNYFPFENFIHYSEVTELSQPSNGFQTLKFTNYETHPDFNEFNTVVINRYQDLVTNRHLYNSFVGIKFNDRSVERGLLKEATNYAVRSNGTNYPVQRQVYNYTGKLNNPDDYIVGAHMTGGIAQSWKRYYYPVLPESVTETRYYDEGLRSSSVTTNYEYNNLNYLLSKSATLSDGTVESVKHKYSCDFITDADEGILFTGQTPSSLYLSLPADVKALADLKRNNILRFPIEVINFRNGNVIGASYTEYKDYADMVASKKVHVSKLWRLKVVEPVSFFLETFLYKGSSWLLTKNGMYGSNPEVSYDAYDNLGNLLQVTEKGLMKKSYLWGYGKLHPVAEVLGLAYNQFFYTGFEDSEGTIGNAKAGRKSKIGGYSKLLSVLIPGNYVLTYWEKQSDNSWTLRKQEVTVSTDSYQINISNEIQIDELRFYPKFSPSQMSTYTYDPLIGMTSKMDANNKVEYYEYDNHERLNLLKDYSENITKTINYYFQIK